jgi:hypothetical protein
MNPQIIPCGNTSCDGLADKPGGLCHRCQKQEAEAEQRERSRRWLWAGFNKSTDNHHRGYKKGSPK